MDDKVKQFIEDNIDLIEKESFDELYSIRGLHTKEISELTEILLEVIPELLTKMLHIPDYFLDGSDIDEIKIPSNIMSIGCHAFNSCKNISQLEIPSTIQNIEGYAFYHCEGIERIKIPSTIRVIENGLFAECINLKRIELPSNITDIRYNACVGCKNLISINIPSTVTSIEDAAFEDCGNQLVIEYAGTKQDWKKIYNITAFENTYFTVNCTDGKIVKRKR